MNRKSLSIATTLAGVAIAVTLPSSPAQALSLDGLFVLEATSTTLSNLTNPNDPGGTFVLNFGSNSPGSLPPNITNPMTVASATGDYAALTGQTAQVKSLFLTYVEPNKWQASAAQLTSFISGLDLDGALTLDVNSPVFFTHDDTSGPLSAVDYNLTSSFSGLLSRSGDSQAASGFAAALTLGNNKTSTIRIATEPIPTPALLPAALGFAATILRKRRGNVAEEMETEV
jgi:hypothetical protein